MIAPGSTIGILGGGQLGRMSALAARAMGYRVVVYDPSPSACAAPVADRHFAQPYDDEAALVAFAEASDVITLEFENVDLAAAQFLEARRPLRPGSGVLKVCQDREAEKTFLAKNHFPTPTWAAADSTEALTAVLETLPRPCVVKTARSGYDGRGQIRVDGDADPAKLWAELKTDRVVVEAWVPHIGEFSVLVARSPSGEVTTFPVAENLHRNHILDVTFLPADLPESEADAATKLGGDIADAIGLEGLLAVELFRTAGGWLVNELAPRPHNSGHITIDNSVTSQFQQHVRAIIDAPLGSTRTLCPGAMLNLLGDVWQGGEPVWTSLLKDPNLHLHLYDKGEARLARKMGHLNILGGDRETLESRIDTLRRALF